MLDKLKSYLNISYDSKATDETLKDALERGQAVLNSYAGTELDYEKEGLPRQLLFDYCRYVRSHAAEMFEPNFRHDLIALREMAEMESLAAGRKGEEENENTDKSEISDVQ